MGPSSNFRLSNVYPSQAEILGLAENSIRKNIVEGKFANIEDYLSIQFNLLREDFVSCVREGVQSYRLKQPTKNIDVYRNVKIFKDRNRRNEEVMKIKTPPLDDDSKKFMNGSLLLFTRNNFDTITLAKVAQRNNEKSEAVVETVGKNNVTLGVDYVMAECGAYFDPYFNVLKVLQNMPATNFPMENYIIDVDTGSYIPKYLLGSSQNYRIGNYRMPPHLVPKFRENSHDLNAAQFEAFKAALSREFVVIQGPPGTGKTFLGLKIVETLLNNQHFWYRNSPILVISQKNHALDRFLEGLVPITRSLLRMGGQCKNDKLKEFLVNNENDLGKSRKSPMECLEKMRSVLVLGMTTSFAARWKKCLEVLKCPIVIVEEAAEVLEAHVVAVLTQYCQHLILLGDHQQLQPITSDHIIGTKYGLGTSLFERMINNKIQYYTLDVQHRMRPEIADLLRAKIYPFLKDHDSVKARPAVLGVAKNLFFINHQSPEATANVTSKKNTHEAKFLVAFAKYLVLNGYKPSDIVILATYAGQVQELESYAQNFLEDVKISTLDAFQGQEANIVLFSLVRSEGIGFLYIQNRICVGLSRAKSGFFIIGNMDLLAKKSNLWYLVKKCLQKQGSIGEKLPLKCQNHPNIITEVQTCEDFLKTPAGGCGKRCQFLLNCGHSCQLLCHTYKNHTCEYNCTKKPLNLERSPQQWQRRNPETYLLAEPEPDFFDLGLGFMKDVIVGVTHFFISRFRNMLS